MGNYFSEPINYDQQKLMGARFTGQDISSWKYIYCDPPFPQFPLEYETAIKFLLMSFNPKEYKTYSIISDSVSKYKSLYKLYNSNNTKINEFQIDYYCSKRNLGLDLELNLDFKSKFNSKINLDFNKDDEKPKYFYKFFNSLTENDINLLLKYLISKKEEAIICGLFLFIPNDKKKEKIKMMAQLIEEFKKN